MPVTECSSYTKKWLTVLTRAHTERSVCLATLGTQLNAFKYVGVALLRYDIPTPRNPETLAPARNYHTCVGYLHGRTLTQAPLRAPSVGATCTPLSSAAAESMNRREKRIDTLLWD